MGLANYYKRAIRSFVEIAAPLTHLLKKLEVGSHLVWEPACEKAFITLKEKLSTTPVLVPPNWNLPFHVYADASNIALGCVFSQKDTKNLDHPIYFTNRQLIAAKKNYTTIEKEALAMIFAVQKFIHYLLEYPFVFYMDHDAFKYLINKPNLSGQLAKWVLLLREFDFTIVIRPRKFHDNVDHLFRLEPLEYSNLEPLND